MSSKKGYLFALLTAICWSTSGLFVKVVDQSITIIAGIEAVVGLICVYGLNYKEIHFTRFSVSVGIFQLIMHLTFVYANQLCTVGNVIVLQYSSMIFVLLYESFDKKTIPKLYQWIVILIAVMGMVVFFYDSFSFESILGNTMAIISGAFFGLQFYLNTKEQALPESSLTIQFLLTILIMIIEMSLKPSFTISGNEILILLLAGMIQSALAGLFFAKCIQLIPAFTANVVCMSEIVFAPLWAFILLKETFTPMSLLGAFLIVCSLIFNSYKEINMRIEEKNV